MNKKPLTDKEILEKAEPNWSILLVQIQSNSEAMECDLRLKNALIRAFKAGMKYAEETKGKQCDECGADIPDVPGGTLENKHHKESCSLYDEEKE